MENVIEFVFRVVPLFLHAMPNLTTLGNVYVYDGLKVMKDLTSINAPERYFKLF